MITSYLDEVRENQKKDETLVDNYLRATGDIGGLIFSLECFQIELLRLFKRRGVSEEDTRGHQELYTLYVATFGDGDEEDLIESARAGSIVQGEVFYKAGV